MQREIGHQHAIPQSVKSGCERLGAGVVWQTAPDAIRKRKCWIRLSKDWRCRNQPVRDSALLLTLLTLCPRP